jgi:hypothetical protein
MNRFVQLGINFSQDIFSGVVDHVNQMRMNQQRSFAYSTMKPVLILAVDDVEIVL